MRASEVAVLDARGRQVWAHPASGRAAASLRNQPVVRAALDSGATYSFTIRVLDAAGNAYQAAAICGLLLAVGIAGALLIGAVIGAVAIEAVSFWLSNSYQDIWPIILGYYETTRIICAWCETRKDFRSLRRRSCTCVQSFTSCCGFCAAIRM